MVTPQGRRAGHEAERGRCRPTAVRDDSHDSRPAACPDSSAAAIHRGGRLPGLVCTDGAGWPYWAPARRPGRLGSGVTVLAKGAAWRYPARLAASSSRFRRVFCFPSRSIRRCSRSRSRRPLRARVSRARAPPASAGARPARGVSGACHGRARDRQRRQVATVHSGGAVRPQWVCDRGRTRPAEVSAAP